MGSAPATASVEKWLPKPVWYCMSQVSRARVYTATGAGTIRPPFDSCTQCPRPEMTDLEARAGLKVATALTTFIESRALPGTGLTPDRFWNGLASILARFAPENRELLAHRDQLQAKIDAWLESRRGQPIDGKAYQAFLKELGYLVDEPA